MSRCQQARETKGEQSSWRRRGYWQSDGGMKQQGLLWGWHGGQDGRRGEEYAWKVGRAEEAKGVLCFGNRGQGMQTRL